MAALRPALLCLLLLPTHAQFDWGSGCGGGVGTPFQVDLPSGEKAVVGTIPRGKYGVRILLESSADIDVQLYDGDVPLIAWCESKPSLRAAQVQRGCGLLPSAPDVATEEAASYGGMRISYSGYGGVAGQPGKEFITIQGKTTSTLTMRAFAFQSGGARVEYSWGRVQTGCCLGLTACKGAFASHVQSAAYVTVGSIPVGKKDLVVRLNADADVDVQLYDTAVDAAMYPEGKAIIAYVDCSTIASGQVCNKGPLGNNDGTEESATYRNLTYTYSGYLGSNDKPGHEWISISGVTNTDLLMKAYGYAAGPFTVGYEYYEDVPSSERPTAPAIYWAVADNNQRQEHVVGVYDASMTDHQLVVRRGSTVQLTAFAPSQTDDAPADVRCHVEAVVEAEDGTKHVEVFPEGSTSTTTTRSGSSTTVALLVSSDAPIGGAELVCKVTPPMGGGEEFEGRMAMLVVCNPYSRNDAVYIESEDERTEYVTRKTGVLFQGLSDAWQGHVWQYDQFLPSNVEIAVRSLRRMPVADRANLPLVARHLTYAVGQDVCYGKWGDGSYRTGRPSGGYECASTKECYQDSNKADYFATPPRRDWEASCCVEPDNWQGSTSLLNLHRFVGYKPVQYCQCFVYAAIMTTLGRALGIPTRPTTAFQSAHDTERNRAIDKFYDASWFPIEGITADSVWSFHVWAEMFFTRPDLASQGVCGASGKTCDGWQAVDATPQELSAGGSGLTAQDTPVYQLGPASLQLVKRNMDPTCATHGNAAKLQPPQYGCYDHEFVIAEVNAQVNLWMEVPDAEACTEAAGAHGVVCASSVVDGVTRFFKSEGAFAQDPWGDTAGTVGTMVYTKKVGVLSEACTKPEDADGWSCKADGVDISSLYKAGEPSSPGTPTACKGVSLGGLPPTFCQLVGPFTGDGGGHRRILALPTEAATQGALSRRLSATDTATWRIGIAPSVEGPLVNEPGHPYSWMRVDVEVSARRMPIIASCSFTAVAVDYTNAPYIRDHETGMRMLVDSTVKAQDKNAVSLQEGEGHTFSFTVTRDDFRVLAPTALDSDMTTLPPEESFYALQLNAYCTGSDGSSFVGHREKVLCEPLIGTATRARFTCAARRGTFPQPPTDEGVLAHLTRDACKAVGITSWAVNDGHCNRANNIPGCFDGGDCCEYSCWAKNGKFTRLAEDGGWEFAHSCYAINDTTSCIDPIVHSYTPPANFTPPSAVFEGALAVTADSTNCSQLAATYMLELHTCDAMHNLLCHDATLAPLDCGKEFADASAGSLNCSVPRCQKTMHRCLCPSVWSYTYGGSTYHGRGCSNPDNDPAGDWCPFVPHSCRGGNTDFGSPLDSDGNLLDYDYCGTHTSSTSWSGSELAGIGATLADATDISGWDILNSTSAYTAPSTPHLSPPSPLLPLCGSDRLLSFVVGMSSECQQLVKNAWSSGMSLLPGEYCPCYLEVDGGSMNQFDCVASPEDQQTLQEAYAKECTRTRWVWQFSWLPGWGWKWLWSKSSWGWGFGWPGWGAVNAPAYSQG